MHFVHCFFSLPIIIYSRFHLDILGIKSVLDDISALSYPTWLLDTVPYMPNLDLTSCISTCGMNFLNEAITNSTTATVTGFLNAIITGCSNSAYDSLRLSGGYDSVAQELKFDILVESKTGRSV